MRVRSAREAQDDVDVVREILRQVALAAPELGPDVIKKVEVEVREEFGGRRWFIAKGKQKRLNPEERRRAFVDGLSQMPTEEVAQKHGIDRATLYRLMKRGGN